MAKTPVNGNGRKPTPPSLLPQHRADLEKSGLSAETIIACGFRSVYAKEAAELLGWKYPARNMGGFLAFPFFAPDGSPLPYTRLKPDHPRTDKAGKVIKYESPVGRPNRAYFPPGTRAALADPSVPLIIVEGEKKAAKGDQEGFPSVGLVGVYGWMRKRENKAAPRELIPDLEVVVWNGRVVFIIFDSDLADNPDVAWAEWHLAEALNAKGATVKVVRLPHGPDGAKCGMDDYLVAHGPESLRLLLESAAPAARPGAAPVRPPDPYRNFPVDALPEPVRSFVSEGARAIGCDPAYLALPALAVAAALIGNTRCILLKRGWTEPSVVWSCIVGDSGTLKSPAVKAAAAPVYRLQRELILRHKAEMAEYEKAKAAYDERKKKARADGKRQLKLRSKEELEEREKTDSARDENQAGVDGESCGAEPPEKPVRPRVVTSDVTIEKLAELLEDNPRGLLVARDELAGWLSSFTRYRGGGGTDLPQWLETFRAETLIVDRKTGDRTTLYVPRAAVSILGGIQPGALARSLTPEYMDAGLGARLLLAMPPKQKKCWTEDEIRPETAAAYECALRALHDIALKRDALGDKEPLAVRLTPEAKALWVRFYDGWAEEQASVDGDLAAAFSKLEGYCPRFTLLHHIVSRVGSCTDDNDPVEPESIRAGIALTEWFAYETRRVYATLAETEEERQVRRLIEFVRVRGGSVTARDLQRAHPAQYKTADDAKGALDNLCRDGLAEWQERPATGKGGRPTQECVLKPALTIDKTDKTPDGDGPDGDDDGGADLTEPAGETPADDGIPLVSEGCVSFVNCQSEGEDAPPAPENGSDQADAAGGASGPEGEVVSAPPEAASYAGTEPPQPPPGAKLYFQDMNGSPCGRHKASQWCWSGGPRWFTVAQYPPPPFQG